MMMMTMMFIFTINYFRVRIIAPINTIFTPQLFEPFKLYDILHQTLNATRLFYWYVVFFLVVVLDLLLMCLELATCSLRIMIRIINCMYEFTIYESPFAPTTIVLLKSWHKLRIYAQLSATVVLLFESKLIIIFINNVFLQRFIAGWQTTIINVDDHMGHVPSTISLPSTTTQTMMI